MYSLLCFWSPRIVLLFMIVFGNFLSLGAMSPKVERVIDSVELGEGPHWDATKQALYFVDIFGKSIHRYIPATKKHTKAVIGQHASLIVPIDGHSDKFVISCERELAVVTWDGESDKVQDIRKIAEVDNTPDTLDNRFNDGKCDPSGRLWAGTMGGEPVNGQVKPDHGALYSLEANSDIKTHLQKVGISNGLAWNVELKKMYYIDSFKFAIEEYDFDINTAKISKPKVIFTLAKHNIPGLPDGMTIDTDGNLWVAIFNGYRVIKIDPRKPETLLDTIEIPAKQTTSVAFGGPKLDELYVTSAGFTVNDEVLSPPNHGATFRVTGTGSTGYPGVSVKLNLS